MKYLCGSVHPDLRTRQLVPVTAERGNSAGGEVRGRHAKVASGAWGTSLFLWKFSSLNDVKR